MTAHDASTLTDLNADEGVILAAVDRMERRAGTGFPGFVSYLRQVRWNTRQAVLAAEARLTAPAAVLSAHPDDVTPLELGGEAGC